jgi:hypothetical protein
MRGMAPACRIVDRLDEQARPVAAGHNGQALGENGVIAHRLRVAKIILPV